MPFFVLRVLFSVNKFIEGQRTKIQRMRTHDEVSCEKVSVYAVQNEKLYTEKTL